MKLHPKHLLASNNANNFVWTIFSATNSTANEEHKLQRLISTVPSVANECRLHLLHESFFDIRGFTKIEKKNSREWKHIAHTHAHTCTHTRTHTNCVASRLAYNDYPRPFDLTAATEKITRGNTNMITLYASSNPWQRTKIVSAKEGRKINYVMSSPHSSSSITHLSGSTIPLWA